jgi:hypothetical protein
MLPDKPLTPEVIARLIRMSGGNFPLLARLLTQIDQVLEVNDLRTILTEVYRASSRQLS